MLHKTRDDNGHVNYTELCAHCRSMTSIDDVIYIDNTMLVIKDDLDVDSVE